MLTLFLLKLDPDIIRWRLRGRQHFKTIPYPLATRSSFVGNLKTVLRVRAKNADVGIPWAIGGPNHSVVQPGVLSCRMLPLCKAPIMSNYPTCSPSTRFSTFPVGERGNSFTNTI